MSVKCEENIKEIRKEFSQNYEINSETNKNSYDFQGDKEDMLSLGGNKFGLTKENEKEFNNLNSKKGIFRIYYLLLLFI